MSKKNRNDKFNFVFSTNPDFEFEQERDEVETLPASEQNLRIWIDRKKRRGKEVSLITGFEGTEDDLKDLGKLLKSKCGVGGTVKDGEILIQGNHRQKILDILKNNGYTRSKIAGGG